MHFTQMNQELQCITLGLCEISGFRRGVVEALYFLGCYAAYVGGRLPTFRDSLSAPSLRVKKSEGHIRCTCIKFS